MKKAGIQRSARNADNMNLLCLRKKAELQKGFIAHEGCVYIIMLDICVCKLINYTYQFKGSVYTMKTTLDIDDAMLKKVMEA